MYIHDSYGPIKLAAYDTKKLRHRPVQPGFSVIFRDVCSRNSANGTSTSPELRLPNVNRNKDESTTICTVSLLRVRSPGGTFRYGSDKYAQSRIIRVREICPSMPVGVSPN